MGCELGGDGYWVEVGVLDCVYFFGFGCVGEWDVGVGCEDVVSWVDVFLFGFWEIDFNLCVYCFGGYMVVVWIGVEIVVDELCCEVEGVV